MFYEYSEEHMQETFDAAVYLLRKQKRKSGMAHGRDGFRCMYRGSEGRMCPVGYLIPDKDYTPKLEGKSAGDPAVSSILKKYGHNVYLCMTLQRVHDDNEPRQWEKELKSVANMFGLVYTPCEKTECID